MRKTLFAIPLSVAVFVAGCGRQPFVIGRGRDSRPDLVATCGQLELYEVDDARNCLAFWGIAYVCEDVIGSAASDCQVDSDGATRWVGSIVSPLEWERIGWSACDQATHDRIVALNFCPSP